MLATAPASDVVHEIERCHFLSIFVTEAGLGRMFAALTDRAARFALEKALTDRNLPALWNDEAILRLMRSRCFLCNEMLHPAAIHAHYFEAHGGIDELTKFYKTTLMPHFDALHIDDHKCTACGLASVALTLAAYGGPRHGGSGSERLRAGPCIPESGSTLCRSQFEVGGEPRADQKATKRKLSDSAPAVKGRRARKSSDPHKGSRIDGKVGSTDGQGPAADESGRHPDPHHRQQRERRLSATAPQSHGGLVTGTTAAVDLTRDAIAPKDDPGTSERAAEPGQHCGPSGGELPGHAGHSQEQFDSARCQDLLEMVTDVNLVRRFHALPTKSKSSVSPWKLQLSVRIHNPWNLFLELPQSSVWLLLGTSLKRHANFQSPLALSLHLHPGKTKGREGQRQDSLQANSEGGELTATTGLTHWRTALLHKLAHLIFENPGNFCFANSAVLSFLWTTLSWSCPDDTVWGCQRKMLFEFICAHDSFAASLTPEAWFQDILRCWECLGSDDAPSHVTQQDSAEFVTRWFDLMSTSAFNMSWERHCDQNGHVTVIDRSSAYMPICLQFDTFHASLRQCDLSTLFRLWCQVDGMCTAMTQASECVCVQVDRWTQATDGSIFKSECMLDFELEIEIPIFTGDKLHMASAEYTAVALASHIGADGAGHYRTAVKVLPSLVGLYKPTQWLMCDDWRRPTPGWRLEPWMSRNVTMVWMVRSDCAHLFSYVPAAAPAQTSEDPERVALRALGWLWWRPWLALTSRLFCVAGVATSALVLRGRRGTHGTGLALVAALVGAGPVRGTQGTGLGLVAALVDAGTVPHSLRGMALGQLQHLEALFLKNGWLAAQCKSFNAENAHAIANGTKFRQNPNLYALDTFVVTPMSKPGICGAREHDEQHTVAEAHGCLSFSQLVNPFGLFVHCFVSHFWGHDFTSTVTALDLWAETNHQKMTSEKQALVYWICLFALNQHNVAEEVGENPQQGPFNAALAQATGGAVMVLDEEINPFSRMWCLFEASRLKDLQRPFELICSEGSLSQRQTCGHRVVSTKMLEATCQALWNMSAAKAQSSVAADKYQIWAEVANKSIRGAIDGLGAQRFFSSFMERGTDELAKFFTDFDRYMKSLLSNTMLEILMARGDCALAAKCCLYGAHVSSGQLAEICCSFAEATERRAWLNSMLMKASNPCMAQLLLDQGADVIAADKDGETALMCAAQTGHEAVAKLLLQHGADVMAADKDGATALVGAALGGHVAMAKLLLQHGAEVRAEMNDGFTALMAAAVGGHEAVAKLLLQHGAGVRAADNGGFTALMFAANGGHEAVVRLLLQYRADVRVADSHGVTALMCAAVGGHRAVAILLWQHGLTDTTMSLEIAAAPS
eukprot:s4213_g2.t1